MKRYQYNFKGFEKDGYKEYLKSKGLKLKVVTISKGGSVPKYSYIFLVMHLKQHMVIRDLNSKTDQFVAVLS